MLMRLGIIYLDQGVDWINLAQDGDRCRALVDKRTGMSIKGDFSKVLRL
jgi:hypothetical protein